MFSTIREPPRKGSLRESVLLLYCLKREDIAYTRDLALAQIQINKDKGVEAFNEYRKTMFPWLETSKKRDDDYHKKLLEQLVKNGPIGVRPLNVKPQGKSRMVQRRENTAMAPEQKKKKQNELYKKLGKSLPI